MIKAVDTHCHLQMTPFDEDREQVIERSLESLAWMVVIGDGIEGSAGALKLLRPRIYGTVGFHPYHAAAYDDDAESRLEEFAGTPGIVAVGETGLDYHNEFASRTQQRACFERQLALAVRLRLPAVIHSRDADDDTFAILRDQVPRLRGCILHCFGGSVDFAEKCLELGCYISFAGNVTFPKAELLREAARRVPPDRLLAETDSPYLAPQPVRGKRCEPQYVLHTLQYLASLKSVNADTLIRQITENACAAYNLPPVSLLSAPDECP